MSDEDRRISLIVIGPNDTPINAVTNNEFDKIKRYAMSYTGQLNQKDKFKNSALHHCAKLGRHEIIEFLLPHISKTMINVQNFHGNTALMQAIDHAFDEAGNYRPTSVMNKNKFKCFVHLLNVEKKSKKTDLNIKNMRGYNALTYSVLHKDIAVLKLLLANDPLPDLSSQTKQKKTALSIAVEYFNETKDEKYEQMGLMLLQAGAPFRNRDNLGKTIEDMAKGKIGKFIRDVEYKNAIDGLTGCGLVVSTRFLDELVIIIADFTA